MKNFLTKIKNSIYNPRYYQELISESFKKTLKYFLLLSLFSALVITAYDTTTLIPNMKIIIDKLQGNIIKAYPERLEVSLRNGLASVNVPEPHIISFADLRIHHDNPDQPNLLVIDTKNDFSIEQFKKYRTICWLGGREFSCVDENGSIKITSLAGAPDLTLNKSMIVGFINKFEPWLNLVYPILTPLIFICLFATIVIGNLLYLIFGALFIWLVSRLRNINFGYKKSYKLGLHLLTLPILVNMLFLILTDILYSKMNTIPFLFTIIFIIVTILNIKPAKYNHD